MSAQTLRECQRCRFRHLADILTPLDSVPIAGDDNIPLDPHVPPGIPLRYDTRSECRVRAPAPATKGVGEWPIVKPTDWCGEFQPAQTTTLPESIGCSLCEGKWSLCPRCGGERQPAPPNLNRAPKPLCEFHPAGVPDVQC